ncbi:uncharacterized protein LOC130773573 [Actinidia eriantha]|uniref:uncharacterized protein LOC130773573 n=1 Tax=Actinidia eriantha TaxID=165200 RepID=UPI002584A1DB|nr:uncharacterized protein LOC130773573 [Actinidia eriantha]
MNKTHLPNRQKRPKMSQTPSNLCQPCVLCFSSCSLLALAIKTLSLRLSHYLCCVRWVGVHFCFIILLLLPSVYLLISKQGNSFFLHILSILAFSATLVISLNLAFPRFPSIFPIISRSSPNRFASTNPASKSHPPVVWSIGSKPKSEKRPHSGSWVQVYSNGDVYEGEVHKGKCSGSGVYYYYMKGRYEGDWVDDKYDGYGVETWAKGSRYRGQYHQGLRNGLGVYRFYTGDVYAGEWCKGQCHGCGVYTCEDGSRYVGEFRWGVKHGLGHYHFRNGDKYAGEYFADKMHGFGVYHFGNGHRYEGAWHEGRRQGLGMYTFRNGDTQSGHWQNGVHNVSSVQDNLPGPSSAINHSKVLNAVQEARRASERAVSMAKVEERVSSAVAAANKAANAARVAAVKAVQYRMHHDNNDDFPMQSV